MQVVAKFIDGPVLGFCKLAGRSEGVFFEEKPYFVAGSKEIFIAYMGGAFAGGEFGHRMRGEVKGSK